MYHKNFQHYKKHLLLLLSSVLFFCSTSNASDLNTYNTSVVKAQDVISFSKKENSKAVAGKVFGTAFSNYESVAPALGSTTTNSLEGITVTTNIAGLTITHSSLGSEILSFDTRGLTDTDSAQTDLRSFAFGLFNSGDQGTPRSGSYFFDFSETVVNLEHTMFNLDGAESPPAKKAGFLFEQYKVKAFLAGVPVLPCKVTLGDNVEAIGTGTEIIYEGIINNGTVPLTDPVNSLVSLYCNPVDRLVIEANANWGAEFLTYFSGGSIAPTINFPAATTVPTLSLWALLLLVLGFITILKHKKTKYFEQITRK